MISRILKLAAVAGLVVVVATPLPAAWAVIDASNLAVNRALQSTMNSNHAQIIARWTQQLEKLNTQIRQLEDQLAEQRHIREVLGEPTVAGTRMVLDKLGATELARQYGETAQAIRRLSDAVAALQNTADGVFDSLDDKTSLGTSFTRAPMLYKRFAAVEAQATEAESVSAAIDLRSAELQADLAATLQQLRAATTQAEVDKLNVKVAAINGQLAELSARRRDEADKLRAQQILNENRQAMEAQDFLEKQVAEERQTLAAVNAWQQSIQLTPTSYTRK
jgi:vacuolar-type H+-ATPase subunit I/STV1